MNLIQELHNKSTLASRYNISYKQLQRKLKTMLSDKKVSTEFGKYSYPFTPKQLQLIVDNIGNPPEQNKKQ